LLTLLDKSPSGGFYFIAGPLKHEVTREMTFISYAQNFEDLMLWRALKHIPAGFYIDVGAQDPVSDSVTRAFYERGWRGINVEPSMQFYQRLCEMRPRDVNLRIVVGERSGETDFFAVVDSGLSTSEPALAEEYRAEGMALSAERLPTTTLQEICRRNAESTIHFLKVDVEGAEAAVLRGMDFKSWRPWILVIEATRPRSPINVADQWRDVVTDAGYRLQYFDGLNQFYIASEHQELAAAFAAPPNVFDDFKLCPGHLMSYPLDEWHRRCANAEAEAARLREELRQRPSAGRAERWFG
jgi:FkbM family methyltransferase